MDAKAKKYVDLFRSVKIASAATVDEDGHPRTRIINVLWADDSGMYLVASKGKPFYKQMVETGEVAISAMCPECQSLKLLGKCRIVGKEWVDKIFDENPGIREVYQARPATFSMPSMCTKARGNGSTCCIIPSVARRSHTGEWQKSTPASS